jgi:phosphoribosyl 1,2-cyclic phosphodiesterase
MNLIITGSSSHGNSYCLVSSTGEKLMIECGVSFVKMQQALDFDISNISGGIVSHGHLDHFGKVYETLNAGIDIYSGEETISNINHHRIHKAESGKSFNLGSYKILPFDLAHDVPCLGFIISHPECGVMPFITDTIYVPNKIKGMNNILIEVNYDQEILDNKVLSGHIPAFVRNRVMKSHMSIDTCIDFLLANDLSNVNNIILIHLSDSNSDSKIFIERIQQSTGKTAIIAGKDMKININKTPF